VIQIPGYRIVRQLGRGGMATVYLAIQESVDREVAIKIMSPQLLADPNFGERFLREARIAAKLHHRHVVGVHDVGKQGELHYIAMEYLAGGPILRRDGSARDAPFALRVTREIATALAYAHNKGFVHRDIKPDNILLRDDGSAALTDFGIARAADSATRMTRTGAVIGTPHYMSPEQARGRVVDGRADLYSLGVVFYELLVGRVPYQAEDSLAVGIMHITEPVPKLPEKLSALQSLLDLMLAKKPEDRYQTGDEMAAALKEYEVAIANGELPSLYTPNRAERDTILANLPPPETPRPVATRVPSEHRLESRVERPESRAEPRLGRVDDFADAMDRRRAPPPAGRRGRGWIGAVLTVVLLGVLGAAAWFNQDRLRALLPDTEHNRLLAQAQAALDAGRLTGAPDSALELYRQVQKLDPDNAQALTGVRRVGETLVAESRTALRGGDLAQARTLAAAARSILQGGSELDALEAEIRGADTRTGAIEELLKNAIAARDAGRLVGGDDSAAAYFRRALEIDPQSGIAQKGLDDIAAALLADAQAAVEQGRLDDADQLAAAVESVRPGHAGIPPLRARIADARDASLRDVERLLGSGEAALRAGRFTQPGGNNALEAFKGVLQRDPNNARAREGLRRVGAALLVQANAAIDASEPASAGRLVAQAEAAGAPSADLAATRSRLRELRERLDIAGSRTTLTAEQQAKLEQFLTEADAALARGDLIDPPGGNAYDLYRAALGLDRQNARAKAGIAAIPAQAKTRFGQALAEGRPNTARGYLDALTSTAAGDPDVGAMKLRLAQAFLAQAEQQIAESRFADASKSIGKARELAPADPAVAAAEAKLAAAKGGVR
jgi:serine/threonine protein kinase